MPSLVSPCNGVVSYFNGMKERCFVKRFIGRFGTLLGLFVLGFLLVGAQPALCGPQDCTLVNNTGVDVHGLYISPSDADDWEENMIEGSILPAGASLEVNFSGFDQSKAHWDIMVTDENDDSLTWEDINLLKYGRITLHYDGEKAWADLE